MVTQIVSSKNLQFQPVTVSLTFETQEELDGLLLPFACSAIYSSFEDQAIPGAMNALLREVGAKTGIHPHNNCTTFMDRVKESLLK